MALRPAGSRTCDWLLAKVRESLRNKALNRNKAGLVSLLGQAWAAGHLRQRTSLRRPSSSTNGNGVAWRKSAVRGNCRAAPSSAEATPLEKKARARSSQRRPRRSTPGATPPPSATPKAAPTGGAARQASRLLADPANESRWAVSPAAERRSVANQHAVAAAKVRAGNAPAAMSSSRLAGKSGARTSSRSPRSRRITSPSGDAATAAVPRTAAGKHRWQIQMIAAASDPSGATPTRPPPATVAVQPPGDPSLIIVDGGIAVSTSTTHQPSRERSSQMPRAAAATQKSRRLTLALLRAAAAAGDGDATAVLSPLVGGASHRSRRKEQSERIEAITTTPSAAVIRRARCF